MTASNVGQLSTEAPSPEGVRILRTVVPIQSASSTPATSATSTITAVSPSPTPPPICYETTPALGESDPAILPALESLSWEPYRVEGQSLRRMRGFNDLYRAVPLSLAPDGTRVIVGFDNSHEFGLAAVDTLQDHHWWLNREYTIFLDLLMAHPTWEDDPNWLPDGRYLWVAEDHNVYLGDHNSQENLDAPQTMASIEYAADGIAFADAQDGTLWRVDVTAHLWEKVSASPSFPAGNLGTGFFAAAQDGSYGLNFQREQLWRVPAQMGTFADPLPGVEVESPGGSGGGGYPSMVQLQQSSYWLINSAILLTGNLQEGVSAQGFLIDLRNSQRIVAKDLSLTEELFLVDFSVPTDGSWVSIALFDQQQGQHVGLYLAPADNLTNGRIIDNDHLTVAGWHTEAPAVILHDAATGTLSVALLPLADEATGIPLAGAGELLTTLPDSLITTAAGHPARVLQFDLNGNLLNTLDLTADYESVEVGRSAAGRVYLSAVGRQSQESSACRYGLLEWTPGSVSPSTP